MKELLELHPYGFADHSSVGHLISYINGKSQGVTRCGRIVRWFGVSTDRPCLSCHRGAQ